jgi:acetylornithine/succinyldiaminopimelate/putrescine aminotransferase
MGQLAETSPFPFRIDVSHASGSWIYDTSGKKYLDFISGIAVSALGHGHPHIKKAINLQVEKHLHTMVYGEFKHSVVNAFAEKLTSLLPQHLHCVYPVNSGTEAVEAALKLAKRATGRYEICSFKGAYHGNTQGALSVSWNVSKRLPFLPLLPSIKFLEWNNPTELKQIGHQTAAVILETIQGDAGVRIPDLIFMQALRKQCTQNGALLILDEIQCGFGRTGTFSAFEQFDVLPDLLVLGKALGGGLPIGALVGSNDVLSTFARQPALGHITTFGGHPLPAAAGLAALEVLEQEQLIDSVEHKGRFLENILQQGSRINAIRRKGLMMAIELENEHQVDRLIENCKQKGLLLYWFLSVRHAFRIAPPLNISEEELKLGSAILLEELERL